MDAEEINNIMGIDKMTEAIVEITNRVVPHRLRCAAAYMEESDDPAGIYIALGDVHQAVCSLHRVYEKIAIRATGKVEEIIEQVESEGKGFGAAEIDFSEAHQRYLDFMEERFPEGIINDADMERVEQYNPENVEVRNDPATS